MIVLNNTKCFYFFQNALKILAFAYGACGVIRREHWAMPLGKKIFLHRKNIGKLGFPSTSAQQKYAPFLKS